MKKFSKFHLAFCLICLAACSAAPTPSPVTPQSSPDENSRAAEASLPNLLVQAEGGVLLRRSGWVGFVPVGFGTVVASGDLIRVAKGGSASVFCGAAGEWTKGSNTLAADDAEHGVPCQAGRAPRPWSDVVALRAEAGAELPYVLSPRNTALLSDKPHLEWHALEGIDAYTVSLVGDDGQARSPVEATGAALEWPASWRPLQPEASYALVVEGGGARSDGGPAGTVGVGFRLLSAEEAGAVRAQEAELRTVGTSPSAADLLVAELYVRHGLRAEAVKLYRALADSQGSAAVWLTLGQASLEMGLVEEAQRAFEQALTSAQGSGQKEAEASAWVGSALALRLLNDEAAAQEAFQAADKLYAEIGDRAGAQQAQQLASKK